MATGGITFQLLLLFAAAVSINAVLAGALWRSTGDRLFRRLALAWVFSIAALVAQGLVAGRGPLWVVVGFGTSFLVNLEFAGLLAGLFSREVHRRRAWSLFAAGMAASSAASALGAPFALVAAPTAAAVAFPILEAAWRTRSGWAPSRAPARALTAACLIFSVHNLDFPFLRASPGLAPVGFTIALVIVFAMSVSAPAAVLQLTTEREARLAAQLELARRLQARLVPQDGAVPGIEYVTHMRPAESVGGDYLDVVDANGVDWFLVGDVTGHGLGAGLVGLLAHGAIHSAVKARPDATPRELNGVANGVLATALARLGDDRHMSIVCIRRDQRGHALLVSGSHDDLLVWRAGAARVDAIPVADFPFGLGFDAGLAPAGIREQRVELAPGDVLVAATDGVFEAARDGDPRRGVFGKDGVAAVLAEAGGAPLGELRSRLLARLDGFTGGRYEDDVTFLLLRATPLPEARA